MNQDARRGFVLGLALAGAIMFGLDGWNQAGRAREIARWKRELAKANAQRRTDSVEVVRYVTRTRTMRDTVLARLTDTAYVRSYVLKTDTLRTKCMACIASAAAVATAADTVILKVGANQRRLTDRFGVTAGYGVLLDRAGDVRHGFTIGATVRVWP